jgi:hypothetical protein
MVRFSYTSFIVFIFSGFFSFPNIIKSETNCENSNNFSKSSDDNLSLTIDIPWDLIKKLPQCQTALHLQYQKHQKQIEQNKEKANTNKPKQKPTKPKQKEKIRALLEELTPEDFDLLKAILTEETDSLESRAIVPITLTKPVYFNITSDMSDANGGIEISQATATNFSVDATLPLRLNLKNGSTLNLRSDIDVTLKSGDIINIIGRGNKIYITKEFNFNGELYFDYNADLEIIFSSPDAVVTFKSGMQIDLETANELKFSGDGSIFLNDNSIINFKNRNNLPALILQDSATLYFSSKTTFKGTGIFKALDESSINFDTPAGGTLIVGTTTNDYFEFTVSDNSTLNIKGSDLNAYAFGSLCFTKGQTLFSVNTGGTIIIGDRGKFVINQTQSGQLARGNFQGFNFIPKANFYLQPGGELSIAPNADEYDPVSGNKFMIWDADSTVFFGGTNNLGKVGIISYVSPNTAFNFAGQMVLGNGNFTDTLSAENLVHALINRSSALVTAVQFLDENNVSWIRLKNSKKIQMLPGDTIVDENSDGSVLGRDAQGNTILFTLDGKRIIYKYTQSIGNC